MNTRNSDRQDEGSGICVESCNAGPRTWLVPATVIVLTILGGLLRFWRLGHQSYWYDEGATVYRICGSFQEMLASVHNQGFPPGWYVTLRWWAEVLERWTGSGATAFSPAGLRLLPALFGTLLVPVMYFLGRQFMGRKGALLVTLLASVNPFLVFYSRDIKMYSATYFFAALHMALFLKWQVTGRHRTWFPATVAAGAAMITLHASGWFLLAVELLWLVCGGKLRSRETVLWTCGVGVMAIIPAWWFALRTGGAMSGLDWIPQYTDLSARTLASLPMVHILGYLWPVYPPDRSLVNWLGLGNGIVDHLVTRSLPWLATAELWTAAAVGAILVVGLASWRGQRQELAEGSTAAGCLWRLGLWIALPVAALSLTWIDQEGVWQCRLIGHRFLVPLWEPRYLGIIVPAWLLCLALALMRLPTAPARIIAVAGVTGVCLASSLSNHLVYREAPWERVARITVKYYDPAKPGALLVGTPESRFAGFAYVYSFSEVRGARPSRVGEDAQGFPNSQEYRDIAGEQVPELVDLARTNKSVAVMALTDREGDTDQGVLSSGSISRRLGSGWRQVEEERFRRYYPWRFYIFDTWRTRVWVREES